MRDVPGTQGAEAPSGGSSGEDPRLSAALEAARTEEARAGSARRDADERERRAARDLEAAVREAAWAAAQLSQRTSDNLFSISTLASIATFVDRDRQYLAGPDLKYLCASDTFCAVPTPTRCVAPIIA